jgi:hypothetical protein
LTHSAQGGVAAALIASAGLLEELQHVGIKAKLPEVDSGFLEGGSPVSVEFPGVCRVGFFLRKKPLQGAAFPINQLENRYTVPCEFHILWHYLCSYIEGFVSTYDGYDDRCCFFGNSG